MRSFISKGTRLKVKVNLPAAGRDARFVIGLCFGLLNLFSPNPLTIY